MAEFNEDLEKNDLLESDLAERECQQLVAYLRLISLCLSHLL